MTNELANNILEENNMLTGVNIRVYEPLWDKCIDLYKECIKEKAKNINASDASILNKVINKTQF